MSLLADNKAALVAAHRSHDWIKAKLLSQERQKLKVMNNTHCKICDITVSRGSRHCEVHDRFVRYYRNLLRDACLLLSCLLLPCFCMADGAVTLQWNRNAEPDVAGYVVHYGNASRVYTATTNAPNPVGITITQTVTGLDPTRDWYFAITATNIAGFTSELSSEVVSFANHIAPPQNLVMRSGIEAASSIAGPWIELVTTRLPIIPNTNIFYRINFSVVGETPIP